MQTALRELRAIVGTSGYVDTPAALQPFLKEWRGLYTGSALAAVLPASTAEVAQVIGVCARHRIGVVPQGGNTGLVGGAVARSSPAHPELIVSARRLRRIRSLDPDNYTLTAEAGCILAELQAAAAGVSRFFPLSLAAEGSCQLGGNLSTNAGGINVLRYGTARDLALGLEVVLPDGRVLDALRALRKDNTGYDLKQLFIGAEGTLGFITAAVCKLFPQPRAVATALVGVADGEAAVRLYSRVRMELGDELVAFELMSRRAMELVLRHIPGTREPLSQPEPWYVLLELASARPQPEVDAQLVAFLAASIEQGSVHDGVAAGSGAQRDAFWRLRHNISEAQRLEGASIKHDISVPVASVARFLVEGERLATRLTPGVRVVAFGHLGDGNIHFNLSQPEAMPGQEFLQLWDTLSKEIHSLAASMGGSFSAEHGVGLLKVGELRRFGSGVERDVMTTIKRALDPANIMNPGKVLGD